MTSTTGGRNRARRLFELVSQPSSTNDPDPGNPVPFHIRRVLFWYRLGFYVSLGLLSALALTTPKTYVHDATSEGIVVDPLIPGLVVLGLVMISHYFVAGSDPGYLEMAHAVSIGEEQALHRNNGEVLKRASSLEIISSPSRTLFRGRLPFKSVVAPSPLKKMESASKEELREEVDVETGARTKMPVGGGISSAAAVMAPYGGGTVAAAHTKKANLSRNESDDDEDEMESSKLLKDEDDHENEQVAKKLADTEEDDEPDENLDETLSGIPKETLPTRAKYCRKSRRVVSMYDHHCLILNTTIGERNRARFWFLLLWGTIGVSWVLSIVHSGFGNSMATVEAWFTRNGHALGAAIVLWIVFLGVGGLFVFHTFLMMANVTTYEFMRSDKVGYLAETKDFDLPFSMGLASNVRFYFLSDAFVSFVQNRILGKKIEWKPHLWTKPIHIDRNSPDVCKNCWENRYWSCC